MLTYNPFSCSKPNRQSCIYFQTQSCMNLVSYSQQHTIIIINMYQYAIIHILILAQTLNQQQISEYAMNNTNTDIFVFTDTRTKCPSQCSSMEHNISTYQKVNTKQKPICYSHFCHNFAKGQVFNLVPRSQACKRLVVYMKVK